jgi:hypothetical protein
LIFISEWIVKLHYVRTVNSWEDSCFEHCFFLLWRRHSRNVNLFQNVRFLVDYKKSGLLNNTFPFDFVNHTKGALTKFWLDLIILKFVLAWLTFFIVHFEI